ncbi:hypothetical protein [Microbulbifer aggregans]|uniref:hypothetical protein n=1 Tax=Microbulbifer aggregans TaxID=1769779 RepID=UPI001CFCB8A9|nr:hypothetical protein [Microbulbifer aggregans]
MNRAAFFYDIGIRLLGALISLSFIGLLILGAYLNLRDFVSITWTLVVAGHNELSGTALLVIQVAVIIFTLWISVYLLRLCTRWYRRYNAIGTREEFDPTTRFATIYPCEEGYIDFALTVIAMGLALLLTAIVAYFMWGVGVAAAFAALGSGLTGTGIVFFLRAITPGEPSYTYYPGTPEFSTLAAQYMMGTEERGDLAVELAKIPPSNIDYPMARKMLESCETGKDLNIGRFGFGVPPGTPLPSMREEPRERIG